MDLYMRELRLRVGNRTIEAPLTIEFDIPFDDGEEINTAEIKVYNLSDRSISAIKKGQRVTLEAGYRGDIGVVFEGKVSNLETSWSGVDKITTLECTEEEGNYLKAEVSRTFGPGTTASTVLRYLVGQAGLGIGDMDLPRDHTYRKGKTVKGKVSELIKEVVKDTHAKMHIKRGKVYIRDVNKGDPVGYVIDKGHGLIDVPEKIEEEVETKDTDKKVTRVGWRVKMLLNHRIGVDSLIEVRSKSVTGRFRVARGDHACGGSTYYTTVEVFK